MKKIQIAFAALLLSTSIAVAQPSVKQNKHSHSPQKEVVFDKLNLSDDQKAKVKSVDDDFKKQMQALNSNDNQTVKQQRDAREALVKQHKAQMESILTTDQKAQLKQLKMDGKKDHGEMGAKHLDKMKQELNLTDQQVSQLKSKQEALKNKMEAIQSNNSLDQTAKMQQMKALRQEMKQSTEQVLTPEQKEKWQGIMKNRTHPPHTKRGDYKASKTQPQV